MSEVKKTTTENKAKEVANGAAATVASDIYGSGQKRGQGAGAGNRGPRRNDRRDDRPKDDMEQRILEIARVTRVMAGGKRMNFRACVAIGDKKGNVGVGLGKGADVTMAVNKAVNRAKKDIVTVASVNETITHEIYFKEGASKLLFKPARKGRGVIAGGVARVIFELAGIKNVTCKQMGTNNKVNNARCVISALRSLRPVEKPVKAEKTAGKAVEAKA